MPRSFEEDESISSSLPGFGERGRRAGPLPLATTTRYCRAPPPTASARPPPQRHVGGVGRRRVPARSAAEQQARWPAEHREAPRTLAPRAPRRCGATSLPPRLWRAARRAMRPAAGA